MPNRIDLTDVVFNGDPYGDFDRGEGSFDPDSLSSSSNTPTDSETLITKESGNWVVKTFAKVWDYIKGKIGISSSGSASKYLNEQGTFSVPPDNNTTYTLSVDGNNIKLTPSSGSANSITVPYATTAGSATDSTKVPIHDGAVYTAVSKYYGGSALTSAKYLRITIPNIENIPGMFLLEVSIREQYQTGNFGKLLINLYENAYNDWTQFYAIRCGRLSDNVQVYGSDKKYIYIKGDFLYSTISLDKVLVGNNVVSSDLSGITMDVVDALPSTYQTATMINQTGALNGHTVNKDVPSDAVFTDNNTTYTLSVDGTNIKLTPSSGSANSITVPYATTAQKATDNIPKIQATDSDAIAIFRGNGSYRYYKIAVITIAKAYSDYPITFELNGRTVGVHHIEVKFSNTSSGDPSLIYFRTDLNITDTYTYAIKRVDTGKWEVYGRTNGLWDPVCLLRVNNPETDYGLFTITTPMTGLSSMPSGVTYAENMSVGKVQSDLNNIETISYPVTFNSNVEDIVFNTMYKIGRLCILQLNVKLKSIDGSTPFGVINASYKPSYIVYGVFSAYSASSYAIPIRLQTNGKLNHDRQGNISAGYYSGTLVFFV